MSTHKHLEKICAAVLAAVLLLTLLFVNAERLGVQPASAAIGYESRLFDTSLVHHLDIVMDDWEEFCANAQNEEYTACSVVIDNESYKNVAIRAKGNTSLTQVAAYGNDRYSFKIEFDHYDSSKTYHGLDKLCLNNIIQDNTYMKDYLVYQMMGKTGAASPLCSYVYITVNGEDWGLYLAVEGVEEAFLQRNYGSDYGELYKPDSMSMGGGRGNGGEFTMEDFSALSGEQDSQGAEPGQEEGRFQRPDSGRGKGGKFTMEDFSALSGEQDSQGAEPGQEEGQLPQQGDNRGFRMGGSEDVLLKYIDENSGSYPNIFDNAKTDVSKSDQARLIESLKKLSAGEDLPDTVDVEAVIRYFVVHNFVLNFDSYTGSMIHNYYLYEEDGQLQMIPWDYNLAFGGFQSSSGAAELVNYPIDSPVSGGSIEDRPMLAWIFASEEYTELYHRYFSEFISEWFDSGFFEEMIDNVVSLIQPYVEKDPTKFCTDEEFQTGVSTLREFCLLRAQSISGQLGGTIGSTSDTQDSAAWIDAGDLQITDMGTMNNAGNNRMPGNGAIRFPGNENSEAEGREPPGGNEAEPEFPGQPDSSFGNPEPGNDLPTAGNIPEGVPPGLPDSPPMDMEEGRWSPNGNGAPAFQQAGSASGTVWSWMGIIASAAVLGLGIAAAAGFKRRR